MKRHTFKYLIPVLFAFASCNKQLGKLPENAKVDGNTIIDQKTAVIGLNGVYYVFANVQSSNNTTRTGFNEYNPGYFSGMMGYGYGDIDAEKNLFNSDEDVFWGYSYGIVNAANGVINSVEALSDALFTGNSKKEILSEARTLRAYANLKLLNYYSTWWDLNSEYGVLLRTELVTLGNVPKKRSNVADSYKFIQEDLDYAIANGPDLKDNVYVSKWAAMLLKMRMLMSHGQQADYAEVVTLANNLITGNKFQLEGNQIDLFRTKGLASKEVILGIRPQQNQETYYYNRSRQYWPGASSLYVALQNFKDMLAGDPRGAWMLGTENEYRPGSFFFTKYIAEGSNPSQITESAYPLRLSEVYLLKAEAIVRSGGALNDAKLVLKDLLAHSGVNSFTAIDNANTPDDLLKQIYFENVRTLTGEDGQEWLALIRLPLATVQQLKPSITSKIQYIQAVPRNELRNNPLFGAQNPGYAAN